MYMIELQENVLSFKVSFIINPLQFAAFEVSYQDVTQD